MKRKFCACTIALCLLLTAGQVFGQAAGSAAGARQLIDKGQYAEALALLEPAIKAEPGNADIRMCQVDALLGLHRTLEARSVALSSISMGAGFRFKAGVATANFGQVAQAVEMWRPLLADKDWAAPAYAESVKALMAVGREEQAKLLAADALQKLPAPSAELLKLNLMLDTGKEAGIATLNRLKTVDPVNVAKYEALLKVYGMASGPLYQETLEGKLPAKIDLKEKSTRVEPSSLSWGSGGTGSGGSVTENPDNAAIRSGSTSYGKGQASDSSSQEGGKTSSLSSPPRVIVEPKVNGERVDPWILDSASDFMIIAPRVVKKLNLEKFTPAEYDGIGVADPVPSAWVLLKEFRVGPLVFRNVPALVLDEKTEYWKETGGVLPLWMLRHYGLDYDRRHGKLTLYPSGTSPDEVLGAGTFRLNSVWFGGLPFVETRIQDKPACFMMLGTSNVATYLEGSRVGDLGVTVQTSKYGVQHERGLFGIINSGVADNVTLYLGPTRINLPTVNGAKVCTDCEVNCTGLLGRNVLDLFETYLDYGANTCGMKGYEKGK